MLALGWGQRFEASSVFSIVLRGFVNLRPTMSTSNQKSLEVLDLITHAIQSDRFNRVTGLKLTYAIKANNWDGPTID